MPERRLPRAEPVYQRLRAWLGGQQILDSRKAYLYFEDEHHPLWAVPRRDLHATLEPHGSADATGTKRWTVATDSVRRHGAARQAAGPLGNVDPNQIVVLCPDAADLWLEEDQPVYGAPKNPHHRVDVLDSSREVRFDVDGIAIADTSRPALLIETGVVPRWYVPPADVAWDRLAPDTTRTVCQYKGEARYCRVEGTAVQLWSYPHPDAEAAGIAGMLAIAGEVPGVAIYVDSTREVHR